MTGADDVSGELDGLKCGLETHLVSVKNFRRPIFKSRRRCYDRNVMIEMTIDMYAMHAVASSTTVAMHFGVCQLSED